MNTALAARAGERTAGTAAIAAIASLTAVAAASWALSGTPRRSVTKATAAAAAGEEEGPYTRSPLHTQIPALTASQAADLPYPPTCALPGARDVKTAYGSIRVYEWGPEGGEKVLLVHGISTPSVALGDLARELVERGYRVMLFDLFGRGYSDAPLNIPYDTRLYTTQILLVLASSPLSWLGTPSSTTTTTTTTVTDSPGFHLLGYSFGGCICVSFATQFPHLLRSLNLVATTGMIRRHHVGGPSRFLYEGGLLPEWIVHELVRRRIRPASPSPSSGGEELADSDGDGGEIPDDGADKVSGTDIVLAEVSSVVPQQPADVKTGPTDETQARTRGRKPASAPSSRAQRGNGDASGGAAFDSASLSRDRPDVTVSSVVRWQVDHHAGFIGAFLSTIRECPIYQPKGDQDWRSLRGILSGEGIGNDEAPRGLSAKGKILVVLGGKDTVIDRHEIVEDINAILGADSGGSGTGQKTVDFVVFEDAGHEVPITASREVADALVEHWIEGGYTTVRR